MSFSSKDSSSGGATFGLLPHFFQEFLVKNSYGEIIVEIAIKCDQVFIPGTPSLFDFWGENISPQIPPIIGNKYKQLAKNL